MRKQELLDAASAAVAGRGLNYGSPEDNFGRIARFWSIHLFNRYGQPRALDESDVWMMMTLMKLARLENYPEHMDSIVDIAGYAACGAEIAAAAELRMALDAEAAAQKQEQQDA